MLPSLYAALSLSIIYRISINIPNLPYSKDLRIVGSRGYIRTSHRIAYNVDRLLSNLPGRYSTTVYQYRYHKDIGTLAYLDVYSNQNTDRVRKRFIDAIDNGWLGEFRLSHRGFELHIIRDANSNCRSNEFHCSDGSCISAKLRCNGRKDCRDGSDEEAKYAHCRGTIVIYQKDRVVYVPTGGVALLTAIIDEVPKDQQVLWSRGNSLIGEGSLTVIKDGRFNVYSASPEYFLKIDNVTLKDQGEYTVTVSGMGVDAVFELRVSRDKVKPSSKGCPENERLCRSGHCLPASQFCNRVVECPDGDDEENCTPATCSSSEFRCRKSNACVPSIVRCDGWVDCHDGTDEQNCSVRKPSKHHHTIHHHRKFSRLTVICEDGSPPHYSLHGSSYCWSDSVCPRGTGCLQGLCCRIGS